MSAIAKHVCAVAAFVVVACCFNATSPAHMAFRNRLQEKYPGMKATCYACHVKRQPKTVRNEFGKLFAKQIKVTNPNLTKVWKSKKGQEKKDYEKAIMVPAFDKALAKVKKLENDKQEIYDVLIKTGKIPGIKPDPNYKPDPNAKTELGHDNAPSETNGGSGQHDDADRPKSDSESGAKRG